MRTSGWSVNMVNMQGSPLWGSRSLSATAATNSFAVFWRVTFWEMWDMSNASPKHCIQWTNLSLVEPHVWCRHISAYSEHDIGHHPTLRHWGSHANSDFILIWSTYEDETLLRMSWVAKHNIGMRHDWNGRTRISASVQFGANDAVNVMVFRYLDMDLASALCPICAYWH